MSDPRTIDDAARQRIVDTPHERLVVVAGAGSGKTSNLVARVARLIKDGVDPTGIAVITFTEKAARELLHRLRVDEHVAGIDRAYVGTIHGFCRRILRQFPIEAGLPPVFSVNDEITSSAQASQRQSDLVNMLLDLALDDEELHDALAVMADANRLRDLPNLVAAIDRSWDQFEHIEPDVSSDSEFRGRIDGVMSPITAIVNHPWVRDPSNLDRATASIRERVLPLLAALTGTQGLSVRAVARLGTKLDLGGGGSAKTWIEHTDQSPKEARDAIKEAFADANRLAGDLALQRVIALLAPLVVAAAHKRLNNGHVTFDDLLVLTRRLVTDHAHVLTELRRELSHVFVDEFQDTDPVQYEIIDRLCATTVAGAPVLFAVGDPKQAIYAFRGADVTLFNRLAESAAATGTLTQLRANYRTRRDVATWINSAMRLRFAGQGAEHQSDYEDLVAIRDAQPADPGAAVTLLGLRADGVEDRPDNVAVAVAQESADIVGVISDAIGSWLVGPDKEEPLRAAKFGDIAILVRSRSGLPALEFALDQAGVPYRIEGGSLVYESREVYEILRVLRAVDDSSNSAKVVAALRTSIFGVSDLDLLRYRHDAPGGRKRGWGLPWYSDFDDGGSTSAAAVFAALRQLRGLSDRKHTLTPAQIIAEIYDTQLGVAVAAFEGTTRQRDTWRRVRFVIDEARQWSDATGGTLREYLQWVDERVAATDRSEIATDEGEDSVRILTIHAAKGLQFPIVVLAGLGRGDVNDFASIRVKVKDRRPEIALGKLKTLHGGADTDKDRDHAEEARLLYVAMTRAQDHLVVSFVSAAKLRGNTVAGRLLPHIDRETAAYRDAAELSTGPPPMRDLSALRDGQDLPLPTLVRPDPADRSIWTPSALARRLSDHGGGAATALDDLDPLEPSIDTAEDEFTSALVSAPTPAQTDPGKFKDPSNAVQQERTTGRYGTTVGIAVHQVLQMVDLAQPTLDLEQFVAAACDAADVPPQFRRDVDQLARSIIAAELFQQLGRAPSRQREMYVGTTLGAISVWGYVDAVFIDDHGQLVIIDFKTDTAMTDDDELIERYRHQLAGYAIALQRATNLTVGAAHLLVGDRRGTAARAVAVSHDQLMAAVAEIEEQVLPALSGDQRS